jgi:glutamate 5-kinase
VLVRQLTNLRAKGLDVILVSSGAIMTGRQTMGLDHLDTLSQKQACASIGQARLMMMYQKLFSEYNAVASQILLTKSTLTNEIDRTNARATFEELLAMGVIPIVNENDTISTYEILFGDNDTLSAVVSTLIEADLLVLLSDIDGLFTQDPSTHPDAQFIDTVTDLDDLCVEAEDSKSGVGTGGMRTKLNAARIATAGGADMIIANGKDFHILHDILEGKNTGTLFKACPALERKPQ